MEREKGSAPAEGPRVKANDGREGIVIKQDDTLMKVLVRFDDGTEEWLLLEHAREVASSDATLPREIGS